MKSSKILAERVAALERCLADRHPEIDRQVNALLEGADLEYESEEDAIRDQPQSRDCTESPKSGTGTKSPQSPGLPRSGLVTELMRADL